MERKQFQLFNLNIRFNRSALISTPKLLKMNPISFIISRKLAVSFLCLLVPLSIIAAEKEDSAANEKLALMLEAMGGKQNWAALKSVYIRARHTEPQLDLPYINEIWHSMTDLRLKIKQTDTAERFQERVLLIDHGWANRKGAISDLSDEEISYWRSWSGRNVYKIIHRLAADDEDLVVKTGLENRLEVYDREGNFVLWFRLDEENRPRWFGREPDNGTTFSGWDTTDGIVRPVGGGPDDGSFQYKMLIWQPSREPIDIDLSRPDSEPEKL